MTAQHKGLFITFEGIEGVGKSTAIRFLEAYLLEKHFEVLVTREPGGTEVAEVIRKILLAHYAEPIVPVTELLLMFASRAQHIEHVIKPALAENKIILCDRFTDASFAYQGGGRGIAEDYITVIQNLVHKDFKPDLTILLDAPAKIGAQRAKHRGTESDRIEMEKIQFFERARQCYLARAAQEPDRFIVIDATKTLPQVRQTLLDIINHALENFRAC